MTSPSQPPRSPPLVDHHSENGLSPEAVKMATWVREDLAAGKISAEQAAKIFDDLGTPLDQRVTPPDTRTDKQQLLDAHFPVAKPEDFSISYGPPGHAPPMTKALAEFDSSARTWLSAAEFPRELGNSLITQIERTVQVTKGMTTD